MNFYLDCPPPDLDVMWAITFVEVCRRYYITCSNTILKICHQFADEYDVLFNSAKSKLLYFGRSDSRSSVSPVEFNGSLIEVVNYEKHLGNVIGQNSIMYQIQDCLQAFNCKVNMIKSHFAHIDFDSLYHIFKTYCMPLYGSQLWDYDNKNINMFNVTWRKAIRRLLSLPNTTHCNLLPYICDDIPPNIQLYQRVIAFLNGLSKSRNIVTSLCYRLILNGSGSSVSNTVSVLSSMWCPSIECIQY